MSITQILDDLRASIPGCTVIAFGDLGARQVLLSSFEHARPQEQLDELCNQAAICFKAADAGVTTMSPGCDTRDRTYEAILMTPTETRVFVRSVAEESDVLCCVCTSSAGVKPMAKAARATLQRLSEKV